MEVPGSAGLWLARVLLVDFPGVGQILIVEVLGAGQLIFEMSVIVVPHKFQGRT